MSIELLLRWLGLTIEWILEVLDANASSEVLTDESHKLFVADKAVAIGVDDFEDCLKQALVVLGLEPSGGNVND